MAVSEVQEFRATGLRVISHDLGMPSQVLEQGPGHWLYKPLDDIRHVRAPEAGVAEGVSDLEVIGRCARVVEVAKGFVWESASDVEADHHNARVESL